MTPFRKKRYARRLDEKRFFKPQGIPKSELALRTISLDEFEAIRLVDIEGMSQVEAAEEMQISRGTVQRLLLSARKTIAEAILYNDALEVLNNVEHIRLKGENKMNVQDKKNKIIAFPTSDRTTIDGHFGHTKEFALYEVTDKTINQVTYVTPPPHQPGVLPRFLGTQHVDVIITGGMGQMAINLFNQQNIDVILGAKGAIDSNLEEYLGGLLESVGGSCDHSGEHHHGH
jgi:predicted DNA-binding protein (UPF0251 family)/predicted Fe-Mo cluster-binding NifX family protein